MLDFDGEDARKAAQSTRVVADVMDELADSGDTLDFLGKLIFTLFMVGYCESQILIDFEAEDANGIMDGGATPL